MATWQARDATDYPLRFASVPILRVKAAAEEEADNSPTCREAAG
jgi:hypothetical protein